MAKSLHYSDYLHLDSILSAQQRKSEEAGHPAHDEMLFIIVHQTYELWFKQFLFELDSILELFKAERTDEKNIGIVVSRLHRMNLIQDLLLQQLSILETMTPLDFLEFRDLLVPASGFQSVQFRLIENRLGLRLKQRLKFDEKAYYQQATESDSKNLKKSEAETSLFELIEHWLERTPFLKYEKFDFSNSYRKAVDKMLQRDEKIIRNNPSLSEAGKEKQLKSLASTKENFEALFDEKKHNKLIEEGELRLSYRATIAALLIFLYRDQPILHLPFKLLTSLIDLDESISMWRYRHALMAHRMIGRKIGTGGTSGYDYLRATA